MQVLRILCFGNTLHCDDGIGSAIASRLKASALPECVEVFDVGIAGLNAMPLFENCSKVLVVDAADLALSPGSFRFVKRSEIYATEHDDHMGGVGYLLQAVEAVSQPKPKIDILAIQPERIQRFEPQLSIALLDALEAVVDTLVEYAGLHALVNQNVQELSS
ncbi:Hydrogenase 3 maturation protease [Grimontia celer]|uniref:Hydrogenase 3 maturation protease n=1 Tax=Grimontia celer TaxID=1796497 RepID=A0A128EXA8_9GAMM|nr:hydrogenase maturation protease [Grimontia celer]CZF78835.1 Hydrogenase 3 maturation protease [Grimontia celer]